MKTKKWMSLAAFVATLLLGSSCEHDWGQMDPPAGDQVYPTMASVAAYTFDTEEEISDPVVIQLSAYEDGAIPSLYEDELAQSPVLDLNGGYARFNNPLKSAGTQTSVSYTFWMKQNSDPVLDEDGNVVDGQVMPQDLVSPIMYWENENGSASLSFSANGWLKYAGLDSSWEENNPSDYETGYITPDEWHYVALIIRDHGYALYIDGQKKADITSSDLNYEGAVQFAANAPYMYFNYGADTHTSFYLEDLTIYRNEIEAKQIAAPRKGSINTGSGAGVEEEVMDEVLTDPVLGETDNSTGWWSAWTPVVRLTGDGVMHYEFTNYSTTEQNYHNWVIVITNGCDRDEEGYEEIIVMRADAWGWGNKFGDATIEHNYNWDTFAQQMDGTQVTVDVTRKGTDVIIASKAITTSGEEMVQTVTVPGVDNEKIGSFFTCEGAHLVFDLNKTFKGKVYPDGTNFVGKEDFSNGFWSCWSEMEKKESEFSRFGFEFVNHSVGNGNYQFWNLVVTNGYQSVPDSEKDPNYSEYYYLRCDAYGWGGLYGSSQMTQNFNWDTYISDMMEATTHILFSFSGDTLTLLSREEKADGTYLPDYKFVTPGIDLPIGIIFTCEGSWLEIKKIGYFPWAKMD